MPDVPVCPSGSHSNGNDVDGYTCLCDEGDLIFDESIHMCKCPRWNEYWDTNSYSCEQCQPNEMADPNDPTQCVCIRGTSQLFLSFNSNAGG